MRMKCLGAIILGLVIGQVITAQTNAIPKVTRVTGELRIGATIGVEVENLSSWAAGHDPQELVPYLNGQALKGVRPEMVDTSGNQLQFHLLRTDRADDVWSNLFQHPGFQRPVTFSVGLEDQKPFPTVYDYDNPLPLTVIPKRLGIIALVVSVAVFGLAIGLMITTNIIRKPGPRIQGKKRPYDLGRFLTLLWTTIIVTSYFSVWLIVSDSTLPGSVLALMGFSGTVVIAGYATPSEADESSNTDAPGAESAGFLNDVLSDAHGYRFHCFQLLLWNLLLGFMFLFLVWERLKLPIFGHSLLALLGISTSIHLGFNFLDRPRGDISEGGRL
ncbi:MAG TPA: hypothetical protein VJP89_12190 [Pyrinomonadaceae bacterium]|nr:hypothetical protein [Pyrinomonadaceae bacterium]